MGNHYVYWFPIISVTVMHLSKKFYVKVFFSISFFGFREKDARLSFENHNILCIIFATRKSHYFILFWINYRGCHEIFNFFKIPFWTYFVESNWEWAYESSIYTCAKFLVSDWTWQNYLITDLTRIYISKSILVL